MTSDQINAKLVAALEGVKLDLAGADMPMEQYATITNKITTVVGSAKSAMTGGPAFCINYYPEG